MPLAEAPWAVDEEEPHPSAKRLKFRIRSRSILMSPRTLEDPTTIGLISIIGRCSAKGNRTAFPAGSARAGAGAFCDREVQY